MDTKRDAGLEVIKSVLGEEYFSKRAASKSSFNQNFRALTEEYCFGTIWTRPGLERKTRSLILLGMLTALGKAAELKMHVVGAINNGCSVEEIEEVLLQATVYCGVPAGVEAFRNAEAVLNELGLVGPAA
jgi:4-carboxymuconolactone decarboxylase